jgi:hypothetical protein
MLCRAALVDDQHLWHCVPHDEASMLHARADAVLEGNRSDCVCSVASASGQQVPAHDECQRVTRAAEGSRRGYIDCALRGGHSFGRHRLTWAVRSAAGVATHLRPRSPPAARVLGASTHLCAAPRRSIGRRLRSCCTATTVRWHRARCSVSSRATRTACALCCTRRATEGTAAATCTPCARRERCGRRMSRRSSCTQTSTCIQPRPTQATHSPRHPCTVLTAVCALCVAQAASRPGMARSGTARLPTIRFPRDAPHAKVRTCQREQQPRTRGRVSVTRPQRNWMPGQKGGYFG